MSSSGSALHTLSTGAVAAGLALALMRTAAILSQPGPVVASASDLVFLLTWLGIACGLFMLGAGAAGGLALFRFGGFATASIGTMWSAVVFIWLRNLARLGENSGSQILMQGLIAAVAIAAGAAMALLHRHGAFTRWVTAGLTGLCVLVMSSRSMPGPFGHPVPAPHMGVRLGVAVAAAAAVLLAMRTLFPLARRFARAGAWAGRLLLAALAIWIVVAVADFAAMLDRAPAPMPSAGAEGPPAAAPSGPNIVLISIDTLRADHLSCYGYPKVTAPAIDRLAAEGVLFARAASTASFTLPAHASMMTGLFPTSHGATYQNRDARSFTVRGMERGYPTLAELLRDHGYDTAGFVSGPLMNRQFGFGRGFDQYDDRYDRLQTARARLFSRSFLFRVLQDAGLFSERDLDSQRIAGEVNPLVEGWLRRRGAAQRPFFLFVHYWDPHGPYDPPAPWGRRPGGARIRVDYDMDRLLTGEYTLTPRALADTLELYDGEIGYVDRHVGELIEMLRRDGALDRSLVIFTADHGESFGEHAHWEHSRVLYEDVLSVPFIVRLPGGRAAGTVVKDVIAQPTDILPMALSAAGLKAPEGVEGRDLTPWIGAATLPDIAAAGVKAPGLAFAEVDRNVDWPKRWGARFDRDLDSVRTSRWKYIRSSTGQEELYDLQGDPGETNNLASTDAATAATLRALVDAWRRSLRVAGGGDGSEIDEGLKDNLRSLGYIQ